MNLANPRYILRNWMAAEAYEAAERGDFGPVREVHKLLCNPYEEQVTCAGLEQAYDAAPTQNSPTHPPNRPPTLGHSPAHPSSRRGVWTSGGRSPRRSGRGSGQASPSCPDRRRRVGPATDRRAKCVM
jgi:hypothetical protein